MNYYLRIENDIGTFIKTNPGVDIESTDNLFDISEQIWYRMINLDLTDESYHLQYTDYLVLLCFNDVVYDIIYENLAAIKTFQKFKTANIIKFETLPGFAIEPETSPEPNNGFWSYCLIM
jgi:hypothetical protein